MWTVDWVGADDEIGVSGDFDFLSEIRLERKSGEITGKCLGWYILCDARTGGNANVGF